MMGTSPNMGLFSLICDERYPLGKMTVTAEGHPTDDLPTLSSSTFYFVIRDAEFRSMPMISCILFLESRSFRLESARTHDGAPLHRHRAAVVCQQFPFNRAARCRKTLGEESRTHPQGSLAEINDGLTNVKSMFSYIMWMA
jgi:hypothetical protein